MSKAKPYRLGDLQLKIMQVLWDRGPLGVTEVQKQLVGQKLAYTTVATMLRKMEDRGLVEHIQQGRRYIYQAAVSDHEVTRSMSDDLVERLFSGSLADTVSHLLENREVSLDELNRLERLIKERKKRS